MTLRAVPMAWVPTTSAWLGVAILFASLGAGCTQSNEDENPETALQRTAQSFKLIFISACFGIWVLFLTFFDGRLVAFILTHLIRWKLRRDGTKNVYLYFGSLYISVLAGKVCFKDVRIVTKNFGVQIVDGYFLLRYWLREYRTAVSGTGITRMHLQLHGVAIHSFNNLQEYDRLERLLKARRNNPKARLIEQAVPQVLDELPAWMRIFPVVRIRIQVSRCFSRGGGRW